MDSREYSGSLCSKRKENTMTDNSQGMGGKTVVGTREPARGAYLYRDSRYDVHTSGNTSMWLTQGEKNCPSGIRTMIVSGRDVPPVSGDEL
jgi:hypothetical protein